MELFLILIYSAILFKVAVKSDEILVLVGGGGGMILCVRSDLLLIDA